MRPGALGQFKVWALDFAVVATTNTDSASKADVPAMYSLQLLNPSPSKSALGSMSPMEFWKPGQLAHMNHAGRIRIGMGNAAER